MEVVSPDPISNPVPDCLKVLKNFPKTIRDATGTTFGKLTATEKNKTGQVVSRLRGCAHNLTDLNSELGLYAN